MALVVLALTFGSLVAAGLPLITAMIGVGGMAAVDEPYSQLSMLTVVRKRVGWLVALLLGEMLTATIGEWTPIPTGYSLAWLRCFEAAARCLSRCAWPGSVPARWRPPSRRSPRGRRANRSPRT